MELTRQQPLAIWSSARDAWETPQTEGLFCEHLDVYSETFPTSGSTRSGVAYALPTWGPATDVSESSSLPDGAMLPTPSACVANDGESPETWLARRERVKLTAANGNGMGMPLTIATLLIGETTSPLYGAGNEPSDGQLPGQQSLLDAMEN